MTELLTLREAFLRQSKGTANMGSPFMGALLRVIGERIEPGTALTDRLFAWPGDVTAAGHSLALRLAGALHGLVLDGSDAGLAAIYPPNDIPGDDEIWAAVDQAMVRHATRINHWMDRPPQTNEVGRSAVLIAVGHWLTHRLGKPLQLSELGASAGLNLMWDRFALDAGAGVHGPDDAALVLRPKWAGDAVPVAMPRVVDRRGTDLTPIDPRDAANALRLAAYIWPDQPERLARTRAAIGVAKAVVDQADAADWLAARLGQHLPNTCHLIYHTVAWQYFPDETKERATQAITAAGAGASDETPIAWFGMEADGETPGAGMVLRLWPGNHRFDMGRVDFHGRWVDWRPQRWCLN